MGHLLKGHQLIANRSSLAPLPGHPQQELVLPQHRPARRCAAHRAFLHRLRHQARHGGRDQSVRGVRGASSVTTRSSASRARAARTSRRPNTPRMSARCGPRIPARYWRMEPVQACFSMLSRAKAVTYENLRMRDPQFVENVQRWFAGDGARAGLRRAARQSAAADVHAVPRRAAWWCRTASSSRR